MKVVHIFWSLTYGGIETMLVNIAKTQVDMGNDVWVVLINEWYDESLLTTLDKRIHFVTCGRKRHSHGLGFVINLNLTLQRINPDAIHLHGSCFYGIIFSHRLSRVSSVTLHDLPSGNVRRGVLGKWFPVFNFLLKGNVSCIDKLPRVFAISQAVHDELLNRYGVDSKVICNGIITSNFEQREAISCGDVMRIVQVSRLEHEKKGQDLLIEAAARLKGKVTIDFIGVGNSLEYLKKLVAERNIGDFVRFLGMQPQNFIAAHLKDYDLFVQPSRYEGFGLTVTEAMAANLPVLVSAGQGPAEVTCGDNYGWTFENGNADSLANRVEYIRTHYHEALNKVVLARQHVADNYDVKVTAKTYLENYNKNTKGVTS